MMIPLELQDALVARFEHELQHEKLWNIKKEEANIQIFSQHLPSKRKDLTNDPYPCVIIRLPDGGQSGRQEAAQTTIQFIVGVVDRSSDHQGYRDALGVANKIAESLARNPMVKEKYELTLPMNWAYHDEDAEPYYFAGIETTWRTPKYLREDVEEMI